MGDDPLSRQQWAGKGGVRSKIRKKAFLQTLKSDLIRSLTFARSCKGPNASPMLPSACTKLLLNGILMKMELPLRHDRPVSHSPLGSLILWDIGWEMRRGCPEWHSLWHCDSSFWRDAAKSHATTASYTRKVDDGHGRVLVVFRESEPPWKFLEVGDAFCVFEATFILKTATHQTGFSFLILPLQWNLFMFYSTCPLKYSVECRNGGENIQKMKFKRTASLGSRYVTCGTQSTGFHTWRPSRN
jgi:hypothetical protein